MELEIEIIGKGRARARVDDRNPDTAKTIFEKLPIEGEVKLWQEEIYFEVPFKLDYENPSEKSTKGDLSYWPPGSAICIFFGTSQPYSAVNHFGFIVENLQLFYNAGEGDRIIIRKAEKWPREIASEKIFSQALNRMIIKTSYTSKTAMAEIKRYCEKLSAGSRNFYFVNAGAIGDLGAYLEFSYFGSKSERDFELTLRTILQCLEAHPKLKVEQVIVGREITF
ncbi:MAG: cyclophilin-like fold protein [Methanocellales archaeon]